jgi:hypothetical protein
MLRRKIYVNFCKTRKHPLTTANNKYQKVNNKGFLIVCAHKNKKIVPYDMSDIHIWMRRLPSEDKHIFWDLVGTKMNAICLKYSITLQ